MSIAVKNKQSELKNQLSKVDEGLKWILDLSWP
jgi:hypothetical protein